MSQLIQKAYGRGWAKFSVPTSPGSQIMCIIGAGNGRPPYAYDPAQNYRNNAVVSSSAVNYTSIQENNLDNQPDISSLWWIPIPTYDGSHTYSRDNVVSSGGHTWFSLQDANTGNTPIGPPTDMWWSIWDFSESTLFIGKYNQGSPQPGDDQNNGYNSTGSNLISSPGNLANDVWYVETNTIGGGDHEPPTAGVQVVYMSPLASDQWLWIYELDCSVICNSTLNENAVDLVDKYNGTDSTITGNDVGACGQAYPGTPGLNGDFLAVVVGLDSGSITSGPAGWTADTVQGPFAVYYQFFNLGDIPIPSLTLSGSVGYDYSTIGMSVAPALTTGNIIIAKVTSPGGSPQSFTFTPSYGAPFTLTDGESNDSGPLTPGTYSVVETPVTGWATTTSSDPSNIVVTAGVTTTVTFTNTESNIVIQKVTVPSGSSQPFTFTPSYGAPFVLLDGQSNDSGPLAPGTYSIVETPVAGWTTSTSSDPTAIAVVAGMTTTVTFTNTAPGTITVAKATVPSGSPQSFSFTSDYGPPFSLTDGQSDNSGPLVAGTYAVSEAPVLGWTTTVSQNPADIVVTPGSTTTVTFTNTAPPITPGHIITTKTVVPPSTQRFTFNPSWGTAFTLGNGESNDSGPLAAGIYNLSESPVDGWTTTATPNPANLTVVDGQTTTVTFTNTSSIAGPPPTCDTPISTLAENVLNRLEEKFNVS